MLTCTNYSDDVTGGEAGYSDGDWGYGEYEWYDDSYVSNVTSTSGTMMQLYKHLIRSSRPFLKLLLRK